MTYMRQLSFALLLLAGCGAPLPPQEAPPGLRLFLPGEALSTSAPAKVSLFFAVDTGSGTPVSGLPAEAFELKEDGVRVSPFESQRTIQPKGQAYRLRSLLLLDMSGSILRAGQYPALKQAALVYAQRILSSGTQGHELAVYRFDGREQLTLVSDFGADLATLEAALNALENPECTTNSDCAAYADRRACAGWLCVDDSTNLNGAVLQGLDKLEQAKAATPELRYQESALVVFTDGTDQAARVDEQEVLDAVDQSASHVFSIGLGGEVNASHLSALGIDGSQLAKDVDSLGPAFAAIAARVEGLANRFYLLEYCSPKRSGLHTLELTASWTSPSGQTLTGSLTQSFDATGFTSGCELPGGASL